MLVCESLRPFFHIGMRAANICLIFCEKYDKIFVTEFEVTVWS